MKNSKIILSEEGLKRHLPEDLWPEILSRLPVKSLLRFRCVSKSWLSMINDPDFCRLHLQNFKDNHDETHLLVIQGNRQNCVLRCSDTFKPKKGSTTLHTLGPRGVEGSWNVEFSIDGLVLLKSCTREVSGFHKLRVWNPSIRKFHDIPSLPEIKASANSSFIDHDIGLGYDPLAKDYKHVKLIFGNRDILHSVAVYTLGACSWKMVPFQSNGCFNWRWSSIRNGAVYLRGCLYFIAYDFERRVVELVSIDPSSEVFSCTSVLGSHFDYNPLSGPLSLVDDGSTLALFDFECDCMWVMDGSSAESGLEGWSRRYSFGLEVPEFLYHKKNGDILIWWDERETSIELASSEVLVQLWNLVSSYNLETGKSKILLQTKCLSFKIYNVCGYIESLVMLN